MSQKAERFLPLAELARLLRENEPLPVGWEGLRDADEPPDGGDDAA